MHRWNHCRFDFSLVFGVDVVFLSVVFSDYLLTSMVCQFEGATVFLFHACSRIGWCLQGNEMTILRMSSFGRTWGTLVVRDPSLSSYCGNVETAKHHFHGEWAAYFPTESNGMAVGGEKGFLQTFTLATPLRTWSCECSPWSLPKWTGDGGPRSWRNTGGAPQWDWSSSFFNAPSFDVLIPRVPPPVRTWLVFALGITRRFGTKIRRLF
jgi:hypothetical protein